MAGPVNLWRTHDLEYLCAAALSAGKFLLAAAAGSYLTTSALLKGFGCAGHVSRTIPVLLQCEGRRQLLRALVDTGNNLTDPITGAPVLLVDRTGAQRLFPKGLCPEDASLAAPAAALAQLSEVWDATRLRLLPYRAVGVSSGLLLALRVDGIEADGQPFPGNLIAVMPGELEPDIHALIGAA